MASLRSSCWLLVCGVVVLLVGLCLGKGESECHVNGVRLDCCPGGCTQKYCEGKGCCWSPISSPVENGEGTSEDMAPKGIPWCFLSNKPVDGYAINGQFNQSGQQMEATLQLTDGGHFYGEDITPLRVIVTKETPKRLHVKIFDPNNERWTVPGVVQPSSPSNHKADQEDYQFTYTSSPFSFAVTRRATNEVLFNTSNTLGGQKLFNGLVFEDQYLELSTQLDNSQNGPFLYGLGERVEKLRLTTAGTVYTLFNGDRGTPVHLNLYGSHPFYVQLLPSGNAHGVFLLNSNGMDVFLTQNTLTFRTIGGILDFYYFLGPSPDDVISQYTELVGRPYLPPYWALGWHQCRWGYHTLNETKEVVANYSKAGIPLDTIWNDIDYMDNYLDFTFDPTRFPVAEVKNFVDQLHSNNQQYVVITDCGIANQSNYFAWEEGLKRNVFIRDGQTNQPFIGKVWPGLTAWPDFFNPNSSQYWLDMISDFLQQVPVDGLWVDMNEASNFCSGACSATSTSTEQKKSDGFNPNNPPYKINNGGAELDLNWRTISMDAIHYNSIEYNTHNMYGFTEANATRYALEKVRGKRALVISRSSFAGHGHTANHWLGDNVSSWPDMYYSIPGILNFQLFGVTLVGADICGFGGSTTEELCARWIQLGAFYPFARSHNSLGMPPQEPYRWPLVANISRNVLAIRYSILPYYYTHFWLAHTNGTTVVKPLFFEFSQDPTCRDIDKQFLIGNGLLVSPVLDQGATSVNAYFPKGVWYDFYNYSIISNSNGQTLSLSTPIDHIQLHIRGGVIITKQVPALTTFATRQNPYSIVVALDSSGAASGTFYLDDGDSLDVQLQQKYTLVRFSAALQQTSGQVTGKRVIDGYADSSKKILNKIDVLGVPTSPVSAILNNKPIQFSYNSKTKSVSFVGFTLGFNTDFTLNWK